MLSLVAPLVVALLPMSERQAADTLMRHQFLESGGKRALEYALDKTGIITLDHIRAAVR